MGARWRQLVSAAVIIALLVIAGCRSGGGPGADQDVITIGLLTPLTGPISDMGKVLRQAVELGVEIVNEKGGIARRKVRLVVEDDQGDPAVAAERAKKLVEADGVDILLGTVTSAETLAVIPVAQSNKVPFFYVIGGEDKTCLPGDPSRTNPYVFGNGFTPEMLWSAVADEMIQYGKRWYFIGNDYVFPRTINSVGIRVLKEKGIEVVGEDYAPLGTTDFSTMISKIENAKPDVLWNSLVGADAVAFAKQAAQYDLYSKMTVAGVSGYEAELYPGLKGSVEGKVIHFQSYSETLQNEANKEFVQRFREKYQLPPDAPIGALAAGAYGTIMAIKEAGDKAQSIEPEALGEALRGLNMILPQGEVVVNPDNQLFNMHLYMMRIVDGGRYEVVKDLGLQSHPGHEGCSVQ